MENYYGISHTHTMCLLVLDSAICLVKYTRSCTLCTSPSCAKNTLNKYIAESGKSTIHRAKGIECRFMLSQLWSSMQITVVCSKHFSACLKDFNTKRIRYNSRNSCLKLNAQLFDLTYEQIFARAV